MAEVPPNWAYLFDLLRLAARSVATLFSYVGELCARRPDLVGADEDAIINHEILLVFQPPGAGCTVRTSFQAIARRARSAHRTMSGPSAARSCPPRRTSTQLPGLVSTGRPSASTATSPAASTCPPWVVQTTGSAASTGPPPRQASACAADSPAPPRQRCPAAHDHQQMLTICHPTASPLSSRHAA